MTDWMLDAAFERYAEVRAAAADVAKALAADAADTAVGLAPVRENSGE